MGKRMKVLFLRGKVDNRTEEVRSLDESSDMWTHLAFALSDDVEVWYWGGEREHQYASGMVERWIPDFKRSKLPDYRPDVIVCRGGFPQYQHVLRRFPNALHVYYGAGARYMPDGKYDLCLVDDPQQQQLVQEKYQNTSVQLWEKPAAPHFVHRNTNKVYDLCYIANGQQAKIKNVRWVYETCPEHHLMLHMGYKSQCKVPLNVVQQRSDRMQMPAKISLCRVGIVPYTTYDSAPRALIEMASCGLPVVALESTHQHYPSLGIITASVSSFWDVVGEALEKPNSPSEHSKMVRSKVSIELAASRIRTLIASLWHE